MRMKHRKGATTLVLTVVIVVFLVATSVAFMGWASHESYQAKMDLARTQAYYIAQHGIFEKGLTFFKTTSKLQLPAAAITLEGGVMKDGEQIDVGKYDNVTATRVTNQIDRSVFANSVLYDLKSTGHTQITDAFGRQRDVSRDVTMRIKLRTYASYMYLTYFEQTMFNERIWFWTGDEFWGRVHSNDEIAMRGNPIFHGPISTSHDAFIQGVGYAPTFDIPPMYNVENVSFPERANALRGGAQSAGTFIVSGLNPLQFRAVFEDGGWQWEGWLVGTPYDSTIVESYGTIAPSAGAAFFDGDVEIRGTGIVGQLSIGSSGHLRLMDNVVVEGVNFDNPDVPGNSHVLGLISEQDIIIRDSRANGQGNGGITNNPDRSDIIISAALTALGESFTFEHQNDIDDSYIWCDGGNGQDERGTIFLVGAVHQKRRGYVHRSNCLGTGYLKSYVYDDRLDRTPPPFYIDATAENGAALFDVIALDQQVPNN